MPASDQSLRKGPSGPTGGLRILDKDGVAYDVDTLQMIAIKLGLDPTDLNNLIADNRAQYLTKGNTTTLPGGATALKINGDETNISSLNPYSILSAGQFTLIGYRVKYWKVSGGAVSEIYCDDLAFGLYLDPDGSTTIFSDLNGTQHASTLSLVGNDSGLIYTVTTSLVVTSPVNAFAKVDTFLYEADSIPTS